jgi:hypothetical protein
VNNDSLREKIRKGAPLFGARRRHGWHKEAVNMKKNGHFIILARAIQVLPFS